MDPMLDEEQFVSFDECTNATVTYLHHDSYSPNYVCDVYHNACMNCLEFDLNTTDKQSNKTPFQHFQYSLPQP